MWSIRKTDLFAELGEVTFIAFVGAGGKTSLTEYLAQEAAARGKRPVVTTTTRIWARAPYLLFDDLRADEDRVEGFVRVGKGLRDGKLTGLSLKQLASLGERFDYVLVEADGAKSMPLKYPGQDEPVVPAFADVVVVVAGLDGIGGTVDGAIFRAERFRQATGIEGGTRVDLDVFLRLFRPDALLKDVPLEKAVILLNKLDAAAGHVRAIDVAKDVARATGVGRVIVASVFHDIFCVVTEEAGR